MNEENTKVFIDFGSSKIRLGVFSKEISKNIDNDINLTLNAAKKEHENSATSKKKPIPNQYNAVEDFRSD